MQIAEEIQTEGVLNNSKCDRLCKAQNKMVIVVLKEIYTFQKAPKQALVMEKI